MKRRKRILSFLLAVVLLAALMPQIGASAQAKEPMQTVSYGADINGERIYVVNPVYAEFVTEEMIAEAVAQKPEEATVQAAEPAAVSGFGSFQDAGVYLRNQMKNHSEEIIFELRIAWNTVTDAYRYLDEVLAAAYAHTGVSTEGDYLRYNNVGYGLGLRANDSSAVTYTFQPVYCMTAAESAAADAAFASKLSAWKLSGKPTYQKVYGVYDWVASNILYDYDNLERYEANPNSFDYWEMFSSYGLVTGTCVCQGFSTIMYRFLLELGIECRVVTSVDHAWNIVKLGDYWYNLDSTWESNYRESGSRTFSWFLKCPKHFDDHPREAEYLSEKFMQEHPMAPDCYEPGVSATVRQQPTDASAPNGLHVEFRFDVNGFGITYQWQWKNGSSFADCADDASGKLSGAKQSILNVEVNSQTDGRQYRCKATDGNGTVVYSDVVTLRMKSFGITSQPEDVTAAVGETAVFSVTAEGTDLKYEWSYTANGTSFSTLSGEKKPFLSVAGTSGNNGRGYRCRVYDTNGNQMYSHVAYLTVSTAKEIRHISVPGADRINTGDIPAAMLHFDAHEEEFREQGLELIDWSVYCDTQGYEVSPSNPYEYGEAYSVCVLLRPLSGYTMAPDFGADFCGALDCDMDYTFYDPYYDICYVWSKPIYAIDVNELNAKVYATCSFDERLAVNFYVPDVYLAAFENVRLEVVFEKWEGSVRTMSEPVNVRGISATYNNMPCQKFTFSGISAPEVGNKIYAALCGEYDYELYGKAFSYSIGDYCYNMLKDGSGADAGLKKLCVNVLNYASAAQIYFNMNPGSLVNAKLTSAQKALAGGNVAITARANKTEISGTKKLEKISAKVNMASAPELIFDLTLKSGVDPSSLWLFCSYYSLTGKKTVSGYLPVTDNRGSNVYRVKLDGFASADMRQPVTVKVMQGDTPAYDIITYSLECYCTSMLGTAITDSNRAELTKLQPLCRQMMNYSNAAKEYFVK